MMRYALSQCKCEEKYEPKHTYTFTGKCVVTGKEYSVTVKSEELFQYHQGKYIQDALVSNNADEREFLMSGISPEGWAKTFPENQDVE